MKEPFYKRKVFWGVLVLVLFFMWLTVSNYINFNRERYVWEVVEMTPTSVKILDRKKGEKNIIIWDTTHIVNKQQDSNTIQVWDKIMVLPYKNQQELKARHIRVLYQRPEKAK